MKLIPVSGGRFASVDDSDYASVSAYKWSFNGWTAARHENGQCIPMHRQILDAPRGLEVDHINRDALDNRRENLRLCSRSENNCNRGIARHNKCGYKGVYREVRGPTVRWVASVRVGGRRVFKKRFKTPEEAHSAYVAASIAAHGSFSFYADQTGGS